MSRRRCRSWASRSSSPSSRLTRLSWWRSVSTTSIASITSSRLWGAFPAPCPAGAAWSAMGRQRPSFGHQAGDAALAVLDRISDLGRVLGREPAHLADYLQRAFLERDDGVHELLDCIGADGRAVARLHGRLADLVPDLGQHL